MSATLAVKILAVLPQTQCTRCSYPDCAAYAQAIAGGEASINQCPPGGQTGIERLAAITGQAVVALNSKNGDESSRSVAVIDENWCIGCTLCIDVCPTDAILGTNKLMHTVIEPYCTGCELCIPVCPVDCIQLENVTGSATGWAAWSKAQADEAHLRYQLRTTRLQSQSADKVLLTATELEAKLTNLPSDSRAQDSALTEKKRSVLQAALNKARARTNG